MTINNPCWNKLKAPWQQRANAETLQAVA